MKKDSEKKSHRLHTPSKSEEEEEEEEEKGVRLYLFRQVCVVPTFPRRESSHGRITSDLLILQKLYLHSVAFEICAWQPAPGKRARAD